MKRLLLLFILLAQSLLGVSFAATAFIAQRIDIQGLQRISPATVKSYLPIKPGQRVDSAKTAAIIKALYQTGFFERIALSNLNGTLIISVHERPTIGQLKISGNSVIATDKLNAVMKSLDIVEGRVYNPAILDKIKQSLLNQYYQLGRYNAKVDVETTSMSRNRVQVKITISEGLVARIRGISIVGNKAFPEDELIKQLTMTTPSLMTFFTQTDRYSEEKMEESKEKLRNYYLDAGYIRFAVKSAQAEVTPDRKSVYVTISINEGLPYKVKGINVIGSFPLPRQKVMQQFKIHPGETFSRQKVIEAEKGVSNLFGEQGYIYASISLNPVVNDNDRTVFLTFELKAGKRIYTRHITFSENKQTNDVVLRRELEQMEAAPVSSTKLQESKHRLSLLPYIRDVEMSMQPVAAKEDQVDINYKVKEDSSAQASFKIGYSQVYRAVVGVGLDQKNFLGTGQTLGVNFTRSQFEQYYGLNFTDPYYTADGISRSFNFAISRTDPGNADVTAGFTSNEYDAGVLFGIPLGQEPGVYNRLQAGIGYQNTLINLQSQASQEILDFVARNGRRFQEIDFKVGLSRDSRDKAIFATRGSFQTLFFDLFAPADRSSLTFYTVNYHGKWYAPLNDLFIPTMRADLGYGNGLHGINYFPFFRNFYAGGIDSVRGYQGFSLGPLDSNGKPYGGNMLADASLGMIFPNFISENLRTTAFFDIGNVYSDINHVQYGGRGSGPMRYSAGIEVDWLTPFGPIELSLAQPLNPRYGDRRESFQFSLGANF